MTVWITCVLMLLGMVEICQWMRQFTLPLPVFILGGAALAIASNYGKYAGWSFQQPDQADANRVKTPTVDLTNAPNWDANRLSATPLPDRDRPISFVISRRDREQVRNERS